MKKQIIKIVLASFVIFNLSSIAYADTTIHLNIKTPTSTIYDQDITVTPCDSDNAGTLQITAYCAVLQSEIPSVWDWQWAPGAFVTSINNIAGFTSKDKDGNDVYHYWSWSLNGTEGTTGLNQYELQSNDLISLDFIDPVDPIPTPTPTGGSVGGSGTASCCVSPVIATTVEPTTKKIFDIKKAFEFLIAQQKENGSFGENIYTDWTALALASGNYQDQTIKLIKYFGGAKLEKPSLTDYERRAMAKMALGLNPYTNNNENFIEKIISSFDGKQFGNANEGNDDIFALIVLQNAGYTKDDKIIEDDISFILNHQRENGSWDESVDMTGATIEALSIFNQNEQVKNALIKAKEYLKQNQKEDGSWGNVSSTAWVLEGILALNEKPEDWIKNGNNPIDYLAIMQATDGGIKNENLINKIWETAYVTSVLSGKTWNQIMQKFEKQEITIITKTPKKFIKKQTLTATIINSIATPPAKINIETKTELPNKSWFTKLLENIFSIF